MGKNYDSQSLAQQIKSGMSEQNYRDYSDVYANKRHLLATEPRRGPSRGAYSQYPSSGGKQIGRISNLRASYDNYLQNRR